MLNQQLHLSLEGIGASLRSEDGYAVVTEIVPGMAADKDGRLQPEDKIIGIEKEDGESHRPGREEAQRRRPLHPRPARDQGPAGRSARRHQGKAGLRADPREDRAQGTARQEQGHREQGRAMARSSRSASSACPPSTATPVAILRGDRDAVSATSDCRKILNEFKANGVDAVVIDLRGNGGGLLEEAKTLSGLFIDTGPVVQVKEVFGVKHHRRRRGRDRLGRPARRLDRQVQRQCVGDLRGRDPRLRPGLDHRRHQHVRQGDRPADRDDQRPRPPPRPPESRRRTAAPSS